MQNVIEYLTSFQGLVLLTVLAVLSMLLNVPLKHDNDVQVKCKSKATIINIGLISMLLILAVVIFIVLC